MTCVQQLEDRGVPVSSTMSIHIPFKVKRLEVENYKNIEKYILREVYSKQVSGVIKGLPDYICKEIWNECTKYNGGQLEVKMSTTRISLQQINYMLKFRTVIPIRVLELDHKSNTGRLIFISNKEQE